MELGDGLSLVRGDAMEGPHDRTSLLCVLERDVPADDPIPAEEAAERFASVVTAMRLWAPGGVSLVRARLAPVRPGALAARADRLSARPRGGEWMLPAGDEQAFREFFTAICVAEPPAARCVGAPRFEMGCSAQETDAEALTDYLLGLRALLDATTDTGRGQLRRCGWRRCAPRRGLAASSRSAWRRPSRSSAS